MSAQKILRPWSCRHLLLGAAAGLLSTLAAGKATAAGGDQEAVAKIVRLNKEARQFYNAAEFALAEKNLKKAVEIGEAAHLGNHVVMAGTYGNLGVIYAAGLQDEAQALFNFKKALELRPEYVPSKEMSTPEVKELFQRARSEIETPAANGSDSGDAPGGARQGQLRCPVVDAAAFGSPLSLRCVADDALAVADVTVYFRAGTNSRFRSHKMTAESTIDGTPAWTTELPAEVLSDDPLSLYFEARGKQGTVVAMVGSASSPTVVDVRSGSQAGSSSGSSARHRPGSDDEGGAAAGGFWWLGLGIGTGYGYAKGDGPEAYRKDVKNFQAGAAPAYLGQATPEVGYFLTPNLSLSLQGRLQYMPQWKAGKTAAGAIAFLARLLYFTDGETVRFYGGGVLGGGEGFRLVVVDLPTNSGNPPKVTDTVKGGPVILGVAAGIAINLGERWSWIIETNGLVGFPVVSMVADFNTGVRLRL